MIKGNYLIRNFKGKEYYLNLLDPKDISWSPPSSYGQDISFKQEKRYINYFILHITDSCNMRCKYCFEGHNKQSGEFNIGDINNLIRLINENNDIADEITIRFFGGEPLLKTEFILHAISLIETSVINKTIKYNIFTNGTIINDKVFELLDKYPIILFISIDGMSITHDRFRTMANGRDSHSLVSDNIKILTLRYKNRIVTRSVIDPLHYDELIENINHIISLGVNQLSFTLPWGGCNGKEIADELLYSGEIFKIIDEYFIDFLERIKRHQFDIMGVHPFSSTLFSLINEGHNLLDSRACGAGYEALAIGTDGKIYPCHSFVYIEEFEIGNLATGDIDLSNIIGNMTCESLSQCSICDIKYLCKMRCLADNLTTNNKLDEVISMKCDVEKYVMDSICNLALELKSLPRESRLLSLIEAEYQLKGYA